MFCRVSWVLFLGVVLFVGSAQALTVAVSIAPLCDLVKQVGRERVDVTQLIPNGVNPHTYEPTPSDVLKAVKADAFFLVGLGFDSFLLKVIEAARKKEALIFYISSGIPLLEELHGHANPHVWLSLKNALLILENIAQALSALDPEGESFYRKNAQEYAEILKEIDKWFEKEVKSFSSLAFVATHGSLSYLARDYGLEEIGILEKSPGYEPSPRELKEIVNTMQTKKAHVIVAEPQFSVKAAEVLAKETGSVLVIFDPLGSFPETPYHKLMWKNLEELAKALKGEKNGSTNH